MGSYRLTWQPHFGGHLAVGHRPGAKLRAALVEGGCTLVVNLLSESEDGSSAGPGCVRLPLEGARPPAPRRRNEVVALFDRIDAELAKGGKVYVHCSAGLHRTGMITYAFFRHHGLDPESARTAIREMRVATESELRRDRAAWGEQFAPNGLAEG